MPKIILELTETKKNQWRQVDNFDSGCGVDSWFVNPYTKTEARVNVENGEMEIELNGLVVYHGEPIE